MKLKNKKTGEIVRVEFLNNYQTDDGAEIGFRVADTLVVYSYNSLAGLNAEWEDYEEPKEYWCITGRGNLHYLQDMTDENDKDHREIGNYFESKEEAEKAVRKLKAWKRLKDNGFRLDAVVDTFFCLDIYMCDEPYEAIKDDLKIVFGDEK